jgi:hypothetical protein
VLVSRINRNVLLNAFLEVIIVIIVIPCCILLGHFQVYKTVNMAFLSFYLQTLQVGRVYHVHIGKLRDIVPK